MKTGKIWLILFIILLSINICFGAIYFISNKNEEKLKKDSQIEKLQNDLDVITDDYLSNAKELKYLLETLLENSKELKKYMPEYNDVDDKIYEEKLRQKVVRLQIDIEELEKQ
jgi:uncharacterized protein YpmB